MRSYRRQPGLKGAVFVVVVLVCLSATSLRAQGRSPGTMSERDRNLLDRETQITLMERGADAGARGTAKKEPQLLLREINEDFARLQVVNNEIKLKASANAVLDFKYVSEAAAEIKKKSSRLRTNLVFPESAKAGEREKTPPTAGLKSQLVTLDRFIRSFVTNPVFTDANVINTELAAKARGDLDEIIDLSDKVNKHAAKLNKANANSH